MLEERKLQYIQKLGSGTHGNVYLLRNLRKEPPLLVCKSVNMKNIKYADREIKILNKIKHPRIINFFQFSSKKHSKYIYMEYANYGDLERLICFLRKNDKIINTKVSWSIFSQIIDGLSYLQKNRIIHRDIKPSNILLTKFFGATRGIFLIKIADFSLSYILPQNEHFITEKNTVGTPYYMAPEIIRKEDYNFTIDIWSLGVLMYELISHSRPFESKCKNKLKKLIVNQEPENIYFDDFYLIEIILKKCLLKNDRPDAIKIRNNKIVKHHLLNNNKRVDEGKRMEYKKKCFL